MFSQSARSGKAEHNTAQRTRPLRPARTVFLAFLAAVAVGTAILMLPVASPGAGGASFMDSLFTAVSALCVTGLIVVDTPTAWTPLGHVVILVLIQIGGFGVMTLASLVGLAVLRKLSLRSSLTAAAETKAGSLTGIGSLVRTIVVISLTVEASTAVLLTLRFATAYDFTWPQALWQGVFHSVSSFNNAGFALDTYSLMPYASDAFIILPICAAIIIGGLGFPVIMALRKHLRTPRLWSMNTRLVIAGTIVLLIAGTVAIAVLEWNNPRTLGGFDVPGRILAAFTQSVQTRTAGFNSIDIAAMDSTSWLVMDILMFIGGGPAGTAGGIKITTFAVLFFIIVTEVRGDTAVNVFGKRLSRAVHREAITVALIAVALVIASTATIMWLTDFTMDQVAFEVISAFATVGMSTGITAALPDSAQLILIVLMFIGRLGPITFASALALRDRGLRYELPKERPIIG